MFELKHEQKLILTAALIGAGLAIVHASRRMRRLQKQIDVLAEYLGNHLECHDEAYIDEMFHNLTEGFDDE